MHGLSVHPNAAAAGEIQPLPGKRGTWGQPKPCLARTVLVWEVRGALHIPDAESLLLMSLKKLVYPLYRAAKKPFC